MARGYVSKVDEANKFLTLASAPRSTEIVLSHGQATPIEKLDGTEVPNTEMDLAEGQDEQSIQDTTELSTEANVCAVGNMDTCHGAMLESISVSAPNRGASNGLGLDDSSDVGSYDVQEVLVDLRDGDLASADLQPGHIAMSKRDRRMMMNGHESDHAQTTRRPHWGSSPDVWFYGEPRMGRRLSEAVPSA